MSTVFFSNEGQGRPLVFIHGFLENNSVWDDFSKPFKNHFNVFCIDLPGFGLSQLPSTSFSIDDVATLVLTTLSKEVKEPMHIVGHSLGGYVALAMAQQKPDAFASLTLFHSTAFADSQEKKDNRNKTIDFVNKNGAEAFTSNFIPPLFANASHPAIKKVKTIAAETTQETVVSYLKAMRDRPDRTRLLETFESPILFIAGEMDTVIPAEALLKQSKTVQKSSFLSVPNICHMGMFEAPVIIQKALLDFLKT